MFQRPETGLYPLLNYFVDLCLLRTTPQALPPSRLLFRLVLVVNLLIGVLLIAGERPNLLDALVESLLEVALMLAVLRLVLGQRGLAARFNQSATAIMGSSALLGLVALPLIGLGSGGGELEVLGAFLLLALLVWSTVVLGHILRHTFGLPALGQGVALGVIYTIASYALLATLFPLS